MKSAKNENIVNELININLDYESKLQNFAFRYDPAAVFEFECIHYVNILTENIVPKLALHLKENPYDGIDAYLPYINTKYHDSFVNDIKLWKKRELELLKNNSKSIIKDFSSNLLPYINKSDDEKNELVLSITKKYEKELLNMCNLDPELFLYTLGQLANPRIQYLVLNVLNKDITRNCTTFLTTVNQKTLDKILTTCVCYPTNITMEEYCKKWIGKDKIYIKFLKNSLGGRYEYAKLLVKMAQKNKKPKDVTLEEI